MADQNVLDAEIEQLVDQEGLAAMPPGFSICEEAYVRAALPRPWVSESGLGTSPLDLFIGGILQSAGITVEVMKKHAVEEGTALYQAVQILEKHDIVEMMKVTDPNMITYEERDNMLGVQVVLLDNCTWKLTVVKENKEVHVLEAARSTRKRRSSDVFDSTTFSTNSLYEIFVDVPDVGLRYTTVVSKLVTINIAFKRKDRTAFNQPESVWTFDGPPRIAQRRIEVCFMNRNVFACQVSATVF
jgi:hypothetical protein